MKRIIFTIIAAGIIICGCQQLEGGMPLWDMDDPNNATGNEFVVDTVNGITTLQGHSYATIEILPGNENKIGAKGGDITITAYLPETTPAGGYHNCNLTKAYIEEGDNLGVSYVTMKSRTMGDERTVKYVFSFTENKTGASRKAFARVLDSTVVFNNVRGAIGWFAIEQAAE